MRPPALRGLEGDEHEDTAQDEKLQAGYGRRHLEDPVKAKGLEDTVQDEGLQAGTVTVRAYDDQGLRPGDLRIPIGALQAVSLTSAELESGSFEGSGALGDGSGKWQVTLSSEVDFTAQSLLEAPGGFLTNLSDQAN